MARSSFLASTFACIAFAASAVARTTADHVTNAFDYAARVARTVVEAFKVDPPLQPVRAPEAVQSLGLVAAKAFALRVLKRRPTVHPSWRMCPSI